jgi:hypothetical protein
MQPTDSLSRARKTLKWFTRQTLVGDLAADLERARTEAAYWQDRARKAEAESAAARAEQRRLMNLQPKRKGFLTRFRKAAA